MSTTASATSLLDHMARGSTGTLAVDTIIGEVTVYLMSGEVIAAECPADTANLLGRLARDGYILGNRARELLRASEGGEFIMGSLYEEVGDANMERFLHERFRENLSLVLGSEQPPEFTGLGTVFADNIQMGHDSAAVLAECASDWEDAAGVPLDLELTTGSHPAPDEAAGHVVSLARGGALVSELVNHARSEPTAARALIGRLVESGVLVVAAGELDPDDLEELGIEDEDDEEVDEDAPTQSVQLAIHGTGPDDPTLVVEVAAQIEAEDGAAELDESDDQARLDDEMEVPTEEASPEEAAEAAARADAEAIEEADPEAATELDTTDVGAGDLSSLRAWLSHGVDLDDEMEAFADHDHDRSAHGDGAFSTQDHNLDRVEVVDITDISAELEALSAEDDEDEVIEAGDSQQASFGAPPLSEGDAMTKLDVANDVFRAFAAAFDVANGSGAGRAALQLLVDGGPTRYTDLWQDVQVADDGLITGRLVLRNLSSRPTTEHRRALNDALVNVIERALSTAADELPDAEFDDMYEQVAGYRQRLGL